MSAITGFFAAAVLGAALVGVAHERYAFETRDGGAQMMIQGAQRLGSTRNVTSGPSRQYVAMPVAPRDEGREGHLPGLPSRAKAS